MCLSLPPCLSVSCGDRVENVRTRSDDTYRTHGHYQIISGHRTPGDRKLISSNGNCSFATSPLKVYLQMDGLLQLSLPIDETLSCPGQVSTCLILQINHSFTPECLAIAHACESTRCSWHGFMVRPPHTVHILRPDRLEFRV